MSLRLLESLVQDESSAASDMDQLIRSVVGDTQNGATQDGDGQDATDITEDQDTSQASSVIKKKKIVRRKRQQKHRETVERESEPEREAERRNKRDSPGNRRADRIAHSDDEGSNHSEDDEILSETNGRERGDYHRKHHRARMVNGNREGRHQTENREVQSDQEPRASKRRERGPSPRKLVKRAQLKPFRSLEISSTAFIDERIQQKYREIVELLSGQFEVKKKSLTSDHLHQMELLQQQYAQASHGLQPAGVLVPRSLPTHIRKEGLLSNSGKHPDNYGGEAGRYTNGTAHHRDSDEGMDAYTTIRILQTVDTADDRRPPPSRRRRPYSAQPHPPPRRGADSEDDSMRGRSTRRPVSAVHGGCSTSRKGGSGTRQGRNRRRNSSDRESRDRDDSSEVSTPRRQPPQSEHHLKFTDNPDLKKWLIQKNKEYRRKQKEERQERKESKKKKKQEEEEKAERNETSEMRVKEWQEKKRKEALQRAKEEKKQQKEEEEKRKAEKAQRAVGAISGTKIECPSSAKEEQKTEGDNSGGASGKIRVEGVYPPPTKFVYKRPVSGRIRFMKTTPRTTSPEKTPEPTPEEKEKTMRLSYDAWLLQKRKQLELAKKAKAAKERQLAKSEPDLTKTPQISSQAGFRNRSAERDPDNHPDSALSVTRASLSQRPSSARPMSSIPSPLHSTSPRRPLSAKPRVRTSESNETSSNASSFKLPFPPESGVPKHVQRRQEKIFHSSVFEQKQESVQGQPQPKAADDEGGQQETSSNKSQPPVAVQNGTGDNKSDTATDAAQKAKKPSASKQDQAKKKKKTPSGATVAAQPASKSSKSAVNEAKMEAVPSAPKSSSESRDSDDQAEEDEVPSTVQPSTESRESDQTKAEAVLGANQSAPKSIESEWHHAQGEPLPSAFQYRPKPREPKGEDASSGQAAAEIIPNAFQYQPKSRSSGDADQASQLDLTVPAAFRYAPRSRSPEPGQVKEETKADTIVPPAFDYTPRSRSPLPAQEKEEDAEHKRSLSSSAKKVSFSEHTTILEPPPGTEPICEGESDMIGMDSGFVEPPLLAGYDDDYEEEDYDDDDDWNVPDNDDVDEEIESFKVEEGGDEM